ncbi:hypothetical protein LMG23992_04272 [Cupriavidus laharis]|jgi:hypothetical protein|uniref:Transposase n=1 Tax=Cupriavidus laharis TaxID=151654 RepID=A0ABM8XK23_9BURK|nr:hypothetical protein LMG23992_04272 [Cupriavidus laharis]
MMSAACYVEVDVAWNPARRITGGSFPRQLRGLFNALRKASAGQRSGGATRLERTADTTIRHVMTDIVQKLRTMQQLWQQASVAYSDPLAGQGGIGRKPAACYTDSMEFRD